VCVLEHRVERKHSHDHTYTEHTGWGPVCVLAAVNLGCGGEGVSPAGSQAARCVLVLCLCLFGWVSSGVSGSPVRVLAVCKHMSLAAVELQCSSNACRAQAGPTTAYTCSDEASAVLPADSSMQ
jgi:hypothetical protein